METLARGADGIIRAAGNGIYKVLKQGHELLLVPDAGAPPGEAFIAADDTGSVQGCGAGSLIRWDATGWQTIARDPQCRSMALLPNGDLWVGKLLGLELLRHDGIV